MLYNSKLNIDKHFIKTLISFWLLLVLLGTNWQCYQQKPLKALTLSKEDSLTEKIILQRALLAMDTLKKFIETGDLITRTGNDFTSQSLRTLNQRNNTYSHCGIALVKADSVIVYHALGGEWNPDQKILKQSLQEFIDPVSNNKIGLFRFNLPDSLKQRWTKFAAQYYQKQITFDMDFDLKTDDKMYCAEYVYKCFMAADAGLKFNISNINNFKFIGVDDLFLHADCKPIYEIKYR